MARKPEGYALDAYRTPLSRAAARAGVSCSTATLYALGAEPETDYHRTGNQICAELEAAGLTVRRIYAHHDDAHMTVKQALETFDTGSYYIICGSLSRARQDGLHAMALVDGALTDTDNTGTGGRRVLSVYKVE